MVQQRQRERFCIAESFDREKCRCPNFQSECDKDQGFDFKQEEHKTFGYINTLVIGEVETRRDIKGSRSRALVAA